MLILKSCNLKKAFFGFSHQYVTDGDVITSKNQMYYLNKDLNRATVLLLI